MMGTERDLAQQQREMEVAQRAEDKALTADRVRRTALEQGWSLEEVEDVLGALGVADTPTPPV